MPDSAFLLNYKGPGECHGYEDRMKKLWTFQPSIQWAVPAECKAALGKDAWKVREPSPSTHLPNPPT